MELRTYNVTVYLSSIRDFTLATRSSSISWKMAGFDTNLNYKTFRKRKENGHGSNFGGFRFRKYVERFKVYALAMNIKDKARKRALFLHCAGQKVQDIFDKSTNRRLFEEGKHKKNTTRLVTQAKPNTKLKKK